MKGGGDGADEVQGVASRTGHGAGHERRAEISRPGDEVEGDRERREDDAGRQAPALEGESGNAWRLLRMREWEFHRVVPSFSLLSRHISWKRSHKICQALRKESEKAPGQEKKLSS